MKFPYYSEATRTYDTKNPATMKVYTLRADQSESLYFKFGRLCKTEYTKTKLLCLVFLRNTFVHVAHAFAHN